MRRKIPQFFLLAIITLFFVSCIKDTDFSQTENIEVTPIIELDFLFFDLTSQNYTDLGVNNLVVSDTTNFDFLNDDFTADNLIKAEFYFKFTNSIPVDFTAEIKFLDKDNILQYDLVIPVNTGTIATPTVSEHIENLVGEDVLDLTIAEKVVLVLTASNSLENLDGNLNLQSKTTYYIKIIQ